MLVFDERCNRSDLWKKSAWKMARSAISGQIRRPVPVPLRSGTGTADAVAKRYRFRPNRYRYRPPKPNRYWY